MSTSTGLFFRKSPPLFYSFYLSFFILICVFLLLVNSVLSVAFASTDKPGLTVTLNETPACAAASFTLPVNQWTQVSLPCLPAAGFNTVQAIFGDDMAGVYGTHWAVYQYSSGSNTYIDIGLTGVMAMGESYWVINLQAAATLDMPAESLASVVSINTLLSTDAANPTWFLYGFPYTDSLPWNSLRVTTDSGACAAGDGCNPDEATAAAVFNYQAFRWNAASGVYDVIGGGDPLIPWGGYWVAALPGAEGLNPVLHSTMADNQAPVITLYGNNPVSVAQGSTYTDPGVIAMDNVDGTIVVAVDATAVDTAVPQGSFLVQFTATDRAGNVATATRTVNVTGAPAVSGLIGHWPLDENSGAQAQDSSGNGIDLNISNSANWVPGTYGAALAFAGPASNQFASTASAGALQTASTTFAAWVYPNTSSESWEWIAAQGDNVGLYLNPAERKASFYIKDTSGIWISVSSPPNSFEFNKWQHIAGSFDATTHTLRVYVNGNELDWQDVAQGIAHDAGNGFTIGAMQGFRLFNGRIDEVQVYDRALSKAEINQLAQTPLMPPPSDPVRIYPLGDSITDSFSGSGRPSYRRSLWLLLKNAGYNVDFVGSRSYNDVSPVDFDPDHDGHAGYEAGDIDFEINNYLSGIDPEIVLLHIGTNDLDRGQTVASTLTEIDRIIQKLRAKNSSIVIFLAKIIPMRNRDTADFNAQIDAFVAARTTITSPIIAVDHYSGYDPQTDNYDNYHPNEAGENKMAGKWFTALRDYLGGQVASETVTLMPPAYQKALRNPLKGFRWIFKNQQYQTAFPQDRPYVSLAKWFIGYEFLENDVNDTVQKVIDYSNTLWASLPDSNKKVTPVVYMRYDDEYRWPADMTDGDFSSQQFYDRVAVFIQKLGQAWDNDPRIAVMPMGILGNYGEQHTPYPTPEMETFLGDAFTAAFKNKQVLHSGSTDYFRAYPFATYWDSFAHPTEELFLEWLEANRPDSWKTRSYIGEVAYNWGGIENYLGVDPTDNLSTPAYFNRILNYLKRSHNSTLSWIADYQQIPETEVAADLVQKNMGYRFLLESVTFPRRITQGRNFHVLFSVKNEGVAPFYEKWPVELVLLNPVNHQPVWREVFQGVDITSWMPGEGWIYDKDNADIPGTGYSIPAATYVASSVFNLPESVPNGEYILALAVLDPAGMHPSLRFATSNYLKGGFHPVGRLGVNTTLASYDVSSINFFDPQLDNSLYYESSVPPAIIVTAPGGDVIWNGGSSQMVTWNAYNAGELVDIDLSLDQGNSWMNLVSGTPNDGSETVTLPTGQASAMSRIRVKSNTAEDISNADFILTD